VRALVAIEGTGGSDGLLLTGWEGSRRRREMFLDRRQRKATASSAPFPLLPLTSGARKGKPVQEHAAAHACRAHEAKRRRCGASTRVWCTREAARGDATAGVRDGPRPRMQRR
jgi:hypothetical protein